MSNYAWVTLATNDSYSLGALVVANSLKKVNTLHQTVVLITPGVSESMKSKLEASFNVVVEVNVLDSKDAANLALLSRPELGVTFTKLHCWRLTQFEKCVFLDADTFVLQNCDELFDREELSAAPDVGWPDCFNSGVFVFRPSLDTFGKLIEFATRQGSFDGGDQGLLNSFFSDWAHKDISKHLPFIYNTCSTACYSYLPAFKQFGQNVKILHFIGQMKPWLLNFDSSSKTVYAPQGFGHLGEYLQQWWNVFCTNVHPVLTTEMGGLAGALAQLTLGSPRSAEQVAYEESMRRQCWEAGNIDYLGKDSFDNIWKRITKTIESKNDPPPTEKNRSPTPQPEEKLAVETKKEVKVGPTFNESEEDAPAPAPIDEKIVTEVTTDGRIIEKKIVTYPGEETTEVEEIEEVDGQIVSVKRSVIGSETTAAQPAPKTLDEIKNEPVILIPGHKTVEIDEKTNSTIVTEKTTTGYQQTITTTQEDGTKKIQTKTFYDAVEIPGEEVEEETYEEIETIEPGTEKTTVSTTTETKVATDQDTVVTSEIVNIVEEGPAKQETQESKALTDLKNQPIVIVPGHQKVEFDKETNTTTVTEKTTTGYQQTITTVTPDGRTIVQTKVFYDPIPSEKVEETETTTTTTVTEVSDVPTSDKSVSETQQSTEVHEQTIETVTPQDNVKDNTDLTTADAKDLQLAVAAPSGQTSLIQKKTTSDGKEIEVTAVVSEDGKTKTLRKTTRQPSEEIEIEEYEETQSYEPGEVKVITTKKTMPVVEALEDAAKDILDKSEIDKKKQVTDVKEQIKSETSVSAEQVTTEAKPVSTEQKQTIVTKQDAPVVTADKRVTTEANETTTAASDSKTETKQTVDAGKIITEETETVTEAKETTTEAKEAIVEAKQTVTDNNKITTKAKQTTTEAKQTTTEAKEAITKATETVDANKITTEAKQATSEAKKTTTEAKKSVAEAKQTVTDAKKIKTQAKETTTEAKETTTAAKQATSSVKKTLTTGKLGAAEPKQIKKEETKPGQTDATAKKVTKPSDTKKTTPTVSVKTTTTTTVKKGEESPKKTKTSTDKTATESTIIGEPKVTTKDGETTTEIVRRIPGGTEHTWTTVRADGSTKTESKKCFDVVELSSDEEYEEYEEIVEDDTIPITKPITPKTKAPVAASAKGPKTPTITEATPPSTPPLKPLVIGSTSSALKAEHEIPDTPPLDKAEQLRKKKLQSAPASKVAPKVDKPAAEAPKAPPRKKEVKKPATTEK